MSGFTHMRYEDLQPGPDLAVPPMLKPDLLPQPVDTLADNETEYDVYCFEPNGEVPPLVAEWLRYNTFTDPRISAMYEGDKWRFDNPEEIARTFLHHRGGRRLWLGVDSAERIPCVATWTHDVTNDISDFHLFRGAQSWLRNRVGQEGIEPNQLSTLALREYYGTQCTAVGCIGIGKRVVMRATQRALDEPEKLGVIVRLAGKEEVTEELKTRIDGIPTQYHPIDNGSGFIVMMALSPELDETISNWPVGSSQVGANTL